MLSDSDVRLTRSIKAFGGAGAALFATNFVSLTQLPRNPGMPKTKEYETSRKYRLGRFAHKRGKDVPCAPLKSNHVSEAGKSRGISNCAPQKAKLRDWSEVSGIKNPAPVALILIGFVLRFKLTRANGPIKVEFVSEPGPRRLLSRIRCLNAGVCKNVPSPMLEILLELNKSVMSL